MTFGYIWISSQYYLVRVMILLPLGSCSGRHAAAVVCDVTQMMMVSVWVPAVGLIHPCYRPDTGLGDKGGATVGAVAAAAPTGARRWGGGQDYVFPH